MTPTRDWVFAPLDPERLDHWSALNLTSGLTLCRRTVERHPPGQAPTLHGIVMALLPDGGNLWRTDDPATIAAIETYLDERTLRP